MQVSQIYITDAGQAPPPFIQSCMDSVKELFHEFNHVLYGLESARAYLQEKFEPEVLQAFDRLNPYAYKSDLLRYALLHEEGGWYFDSAVRPIQKVNVPDSVDMIVFKDMPIFSQTTWTCANTVLYAKPKQAVYAQCLEIILEHVKNKYYGTNALSPTGPSVLGKAMAAYGERPGIVVGDFIFLTPLHSQRNSAFVLPDGLILALGKPAAGGDLSQLGAKGSNNYNFFYQTRTVYK